MEMDSSLERHYAHITQEVCKDGKAKEVPINSDTRRLIENSFIDASGKVVVNPKGRVLNVHMVVKKVFQITNRPRAQEHKVYKEELLQEQGVGEQHLNERNLFHGTKHLAGALGIIEDGFDFRLYRDSVKWGKGSYFATNLKTSALVYTEPDAHKLRYLFLARVLLGKSAQAKCTDVRAPKGFHSTFDRPQIPSLYVVFHIKQAYPEYLVCFEAEHRGEEPRPHPFTPLPNGYLESLSAPAVVLTSRSHEISQRCSRLESLQSHQAGGNGHSGTSGAPQPQPERRYIVLGMTTIRKRFRQGVFKGIVKSRNAQGMYLIEYEDGDKEEMDQATLLTFMQAKNCEKCKAVFYGTLVCSGCQAVSYCSKKCQKLDWPNHKAVCQNKLKTVGKHNPARTLRSTMHQTSSQKRKQQDLYRSSMTFSAVSQIEFIIMMEGDIPSEVIKRIRESPGAQFDLKWRCWRLPLSSYHQLYEQMSPWQERGLRVQRIPQHVLFTATGRAEQPAPLVPAAARAPAPTSQCAHKRPKNTAPKKVRFAGNNRSTKQTPAASTAYVGRLPQWSCSLCTLLNDACTLVCIACCETTREH